MYKTGRKFKIVSNSSSLYLHKGDICVVEGSSNSSVRFRKKGKSLLDGLSFVVIVNENKLGRIVSEEIWTPMYGSGGDKPLDVDKKWDGRIVIEYNNWFYKILRALSA